MTSILASNTSVWLLGYQDSLSKSRNSKIPSFNCSNLDYSNGLFSFKSFTTGGNQSRRKIWPIFSGTLDGATDPDDSEDEQDKQESPKSEIGGVTFIALPPFI
jgi:hypothetical protein